MGLKVLIIIFITIAITVFCYKLFFSDIRKMGYTYASIDRNSKVVGKYISYIFIGSFFIVGTIFFKIFPNEKKNNYAGTKIYYKNDTLFVDNKLHNSYYVKKNIFDSDGFWLNEEIVIKNQLK